MSLVNQVSCDGCGKRVDVATPGYAVHGVDRPDGWVQLSIAVYPTGFFGLSRMSDFCSYSCMDTHVLAVIREKLVAA